MIGGIIFRCIRFDLSKLQHAFGVLR